MAVDIYVRILIFSCLCCTYVTCKLNLSEESKCVTDGHNGTCIPIYKCESAALTYLLRNAGHRTPPFYVAPSLPDLPDICSYKDNEPVICCTDCKRDEYYRNYTVTVGGRLVRKSSSIAFNKCLENYQRLPFSCRGGGLIRIHKDWREEKKCHDHFLEVSLVAGGRPAQRWEFPHMALIGYGEDLEFTQWLCAGSVISERFILTAAHCTSTHVLGNITYAALGLLKRSDPKKYWKIYKIKRIIIHPQYKSPSKYHDIALLETELEINFGRDVLPACLGVLNDTAIFAEAAGWGRLGTRQNLSDTLQVVKLDEYTESECRRLFQPHRHLKNGYDHEKQMCYGNYYNITDTCEGDSGGPLQIDAVNCLFTVIGVTSYGKDCGILGAAGMYTRVSYYVPWIESIVWPEETKARKKDKE